MARIISDTIIVERFSLINESMPIPPLFMAANL